MQAIMEFLRLMPESAGLTVLILSVIAAAGLGLGSIRIYGISLGIGGVLFAGLLIGYLCDLVVFPKGAHMANEHVLEFAREFGLILFVYTVGVQVGPGFLASLRKNGLPLNLMAASLVLMGAIVAYLIHKIAKVDMPIVAGLFSGGTTNTPAMAAANDALQNLVQFKGNPAGLKAARDSVGAAYATAYPFGVMGIIFTMLLMRFVFRINLTKEADEIKRQQGSGKTITIRNYEVTNPRLDGQPVKALGDLKEQGVTISRILHNNRQQVARASTLLHTGDVVLAVGPSESLEQLSGTIGHESKMDLKAAPSQIGYRRILITQRPALGKTIEELNLLERFGVTITRVRRGDIELPPGPHIRLNFGDNVQAVGEESGIKQVAQELGDSLKRLNHPQVIPIFVGIALGVLLGCIPVKLGMAAPARLGLAGGPLIMAIILSRLGHFGPLVWYMPLSANFIVREVGIVLFLSSVGFLSGGKFVNAFYQHGHFVSTGFQWMAYGALITAIPLLTVAFFARIFMKTNFMSICGMIAGASTDPPALAFAGAVTGSDAPSVAYATVYPLTMLLRVLFGQMMILLFM